MWLSATWNLNNSTITLIIIIIPIFTAFFLDKKPGLATTATSPGVFAPYVAERNFRGWISGAGNLLLGDFIPIIQSTVPESIDFNHRLSHWPHCIFVHLQTAKRRGVACFTLMPVLDAKQQKSVFHLARQWISLETNYRWVPFFSQCGKGSGMLILEDSLDWPKQLTRWLNTQLAVSLTTAGTSHYRHSMDPNVYNNNNACRRRWLRYMM